MEEKWGFFHYQKTLRRLRWWKSFLRAGKIVNLSFKQFLCFREAYKWGNYILMVGYSKWVVELSLSHLWIKRLREIKIEYFIRKNSWRNSQNNFEFKIFRLPSWAYGIYQSL